MVAALRDEPAGGVAVPAPQDEPGEDVAVARGRRSQSMAPPSGADPAIDAEVGEESLSALAARAAAALDAPPARAAPPAQGAPVAEADAAVRQGFLAECVAEHLTASTARIATGMDRLRETQTRVRGVLQDTDALPELHDGAELDEELETAAAIALSVRREANAIASVAKRLASFSRMPNGDADRGMINLNACVDEVIAATGAQDFATVATRLGRVPEIFASKTDIRLLLTQIIENSVHAVEGLADRDATIKIDTARKNDEILITIIDNGTGIPSERRSKVFRAFYTSRDGAMGLGLTLAGHLARKYEGAIRINSLPGQGTVTRISLPADPSGP